MAGSVSHVPFKTFTFKNNFTTPFLWNFYDGVQLSQGYRANVKRLFTTPPLGLPGTHLVNLRSTKGWVTLDISKFRTPTLRIQHLNCSFRLTHLLFICEQTLFNFSNIQLEQQLHLQHSPFFIHPAIWNTTTLFKQLNKAKVY